MSLFPKCKVRFMSTRSLNLWYHEPQLTIYNRSLRATKTSQFYTKLVNISKINVNTINLSIYLFKYSITWTPTFLTNFLQYIQFFKNTLLLSLQFVRESFTEGIVYLQCLFVACFIDACLTDDEPLWEPIEWSLVQSWIMFIFLFAWIAENLITSRYGSYTGRDKRVWSSWYKTFWLVELWYALSLGAAGLWVMIPHYYEVTYNTAYIVAWWDWYSREFFCLFLLLYTIVLYLAHWLLLNVRWGNWKKSLLIILLINIFLAYLLYTQFFIAFFGYFTDPMWYSKTRIVDYIQMSHEPNRWGYGPAKRDHFNYHNSKTVFWFKNDGPYASFFLMVNFFLTLSIFFMLFFWLSLARRVYATQEISYTYTTYCVSALRQYLYFFLLLFVTIFCSYFFIFWRLPIEFYWSLTYPSLGNTLYDLISQVWTDWTLNISFRTLLTKLLNFLL
jgi:hypothetical protein